MKLGAICFAVVMTLAWIFSISLACAQDRNEAAETGIPRIGHTDLRLILLARQYKNWNDEALVQHLIGRLDHYDAFKKRDLIQKYAQAARSEIEKWEGTDNFLLGATNVEVPNETLSSALRLTPPRAYRLRMPGYNARDLYISMAIGKFNLDTQTFALGGSGLPCGNVYGSSWSTGYSNSRSHTPTPLGWEFKRWKSPSTRCLIHVPDEKLAREIERVRHSGKLKIGVTLHSHLTDEIDKNGIYTIEVSRMDVNFYSLVRNTSSETALLRIGDTFTLYPRQASNSTRAVPEPL